MSYTEIREGLSELSVDELVELELDIHEEIRRQVREQSHLQEEAAGNPPKSA